MFSRSKKLSLSLLLAAGLGACAHQARLPPDLLAQSEGEIRAAETAGAASVPKAELYVKLAKEEIEAAKLLARDGEEARARVVLLRAKADAELALSLAKEAKLQQEARAALDQVQKMNADASSRDLDSTRLKDSMD